VERNLSVVTAKKPAGSAATLPPKRRRYSRLACRVSVALTESEGSGHLIFPTGNLSLGGVFLESDLLLEVGSVVSLAFRLPNSKNTTSAEAVVVRVADEDSLGRSQPGMGLEFTRMSAGDRTLLEQYLKANLPALKEDSSGR